MPVAAPQDQAVPVAIHQSNGRPALHDHAAPLQSEFDDSHGDGQLVVWIWRQTVYRAWLLVKGALGVLYICVVSEGLRFLVPGLGMRLHKVPGLSFLYDYEDLHRLDLAHVLSLFMLFAVFYLWDKMLLLWLDSSENFDDGGWNPQANRQLIVALGWIILGADACLFYVAMTQVGWGATSFSFAALLATAAYLAILIFVSYVTINLRKAIPRLRKAY